ncbi:MAG: aminotransferase class I/II-fold pyridoxal phosphate-dependent enzyme [Saprospiraceae bacterium]|nr:aminotransferase class I/II-fold pyridoxal phosphate-dependent enzyme [Saprospiraceae bacterium]
MNNAFFNDILQNAPARINATQTSSHLLLDKNEQCDDVAFSIKQQVLGGLMDANWNRYPSADCSDIEAAVANYCGLNPEHIVLSPGSANIITTLLNYFALNKKRIVIAQPTYTLFDYHCKTYNIEYTPWLLTPELEYDYDNMPLLEPGSVLIITTPNNPVGNSMKREKLEKILSSNPDSFVLVDAVYAEFADEDFSPLIRQYDNLMVLRSFSKAFPIAGLRFGYLCAAPPTAAIVKKLMLQFSINHLTQVFAREVLFSDEFIQRSRQQVKTIIRERTRMHRYLTYKFDSSALKVFRSEGNFLLVRVFDDADFQHVLAGLEKNRIKVLNTSPFPLLRNTFRVSIGSAEENNAFVQCLMQSMGQERLRQPQVRLMDGCYSEEQLSRLQAVG